MSEQVIKISIPLDEDGFIEMECEYCKARFMLKNNVYDNENYLYFFCPICGIPNKINSFFIPEVLEKAQQMATNYMLDEIDKMLGKSMRKINNGGLIKMSVRKSERVQERELYKPSDSYVICHKKCCGIDVKVKSIDKETGTYCPICGIEQ